MSLSTYFQDPPAKDVNRKTSKKCQILKGSPRYRILDVHVPRKREAKTYVHIQIKGTRASFSKSLTDVYTEAWLPFFSTQEAARLGKLITAQKMAMKKTRTRVKPTHHPLQVTLLFSECSLLRHCYSQIS